MKKSFGFFTALLVGGVALLSSCDKDVDTSALSVDVTSQSATIKGYVYADMDLNVINGITDSIPSGTYILVTVPYNQFSSGSGSGEWKDTAWVGKDGKFTISVPTDDNGVTVTLKPIDFVGNQKQLVTSSLKSKSLKFSADAVTVDVKPNDYKVQIINYVEASSNIVNQKNWTISGVVVAENDTTDYVNGVLMPVGGTAVNARDYVKSSVVITFYAEDGSWSSNVTTTTAKGNNIKGDSRDYTEFSVSVPDGKKIYIKYYVPMERLFSHADGAINKLNWRQNYIYKTSGTQFSGDAGFSSDLVNQYIDLGEGESAVFIQK
jgi:hypothetical protein